MTKRFYFLYFIGILIPYFASAQADIASARLLGVGATVTVSGIVTNGSELGVIRYFQDNTAGIAAYGTQLVGINRGDSVTITGTLVDYNGLLEIQPVNTFSIINTGNLIQSPLAITPAQLGEINEAQLVKINNVSFQNGGQTIAGNNSYIATDGISSFTTYIRTGSPLIGQILPTGNIDIVGISSQYLTTYQLLPRDINDFIIPAAIQIVSPITVSNIVTDGFKLSWLTDSLGTSQVKYGRTANLELGFANGSMNTTNHEVSISGLNPADIIYGRCFSVNGIDTAYSAMGIYCTQSLSSGNMITYFNLPVDNSVAINQNSLQLFEAIDDTLIAYIDRATETIDITIYDFNLSNISNISNAINAAYNRGVLVRVISDGSLAASNSGITALNPNINKIASPTGGSYGIMHNKFAIIDAKHADPNKPLVWTGATNWQDGQINRDANNVIIFQDQSLAKAYTLEFNEMWGDSSTVPNLTNSKFGPFKTDNTPHEFNIGGKRVESYFSPSDNVNSKLVNTINTANNSIYFASMVITRADIAQAIIDKAALGVDAYGITHTSNGTTTWNQLVTGLPVGHLQANTDSANSIMHHKYVIIDQENNSSDSQLWTGSHNWSNNANVRNDENTVVVHDQNIANQFYQEFHARFIQNGGVALNTITPQNDNNNISIYPNPNNQNILGVSLKKVANEGTIHIVNIQGQLISPETLVVTQNTTKQFNLNIEHLGTGVYFIEFNFNGIKEVKRLVKL